MWVVGRAGVYSWVAVCSWGVVFPYWPEIQKDLMQMRVLKISMSLSHIKIGFWPKTQKDLMQTKKKIRVLNISMPLSHIKIGFSPKTQKDLMQTKKDPGSKNFNATVSHQNWILTQNPKRLNADQKKIRVLKISMPLSHIKIGFWPKTQKDLMQTKNRSGSWKFQCRCLTSNSHFDPKSKKT